MLSELLPLLIVSVSPLDCGTPATVGPTLRSERWPEQYSISGTRSEPVYESHLRLVRDHDRFSLAGGAPSGEAPLTSSVVVDRQGNIVGSNPRGEPVMCRPGAQSRCELPLQGFLASAAVLAITRRGVTLPVVATLPFAGRCVACIDATALQALEGGVEPVVDPCVDQATGAVFGFRHRRSGRFEGASLDPASVRVHLGASDTALRPASP